jgi:hypothetical protein
MPELSGSWWRGDSKLFQCKTGRQILRRLTDFVKLPRNWRGNEGVPVRMTLYLQSCSVILL